MLNFLYLQTDELLEVFAEFDEQGTGQKASAVQAEMAKILELAHVMNDEIVKVGKLIFEQKVGLVAERELFQVWRLTSEMVEKADDLGRSDQSRLPPVQVNFLGFRVQQQVQLWSGPVLCFRRREVSEKSVSQRFS